MTIIGNFGYSLASAFMMLTSPPQMWVMLLSGQRPDVDAWHDEDYEAGQ